MKIFLVALCVLLLLVIGCMWVGIYVMSDEVVRLNLEKEKFFAAGVALGNKAHQEFPEADNFQQTRVAWDILEQMQNEKKGWVDMFMIPDESYRPYPGPLRLLRVSSEPTTKLDSEAK